MTQSQATDQTPAVPVSKPGDPPDDRRIRTNEAPAPSSQPLTPQTRHEYEARIAQLERDLANRTLALVEANNERRRQMDIVDPRTMAPEDLRSSIKASPRYQEFDENAQEHIFAVARITGLNPEFEMHYMKIRGKLVLYADYKALMRRVRDRYPHIQTYDRQMTPQEMKQRGVPERDIQEGSIMVEFTIENLIDAYLARMAGLEYQPWKGVAWAAAFKDEEEWDRQKRRYVPTGRRVPADVPHTRDLYFVAWKRALRAACYQVGDLGISLVEVPGAQLVEDKYHFDLTNQVKGQLTAGLPSQIEGPQPDQDDVRAGNDQPPAADPKLEPVPDGETWQAHIANWTSADWQAYWRKMTHYDLTGDDVRAVLGVDIVKDFAGTVDEHNTLINSAVLAKRRGDSIPTPAQPETPAPASNRLDTSGDEGSFIVNRVLIQGQPGSKPVLTVYGLAPSGKEDPLPAIVGEFATSEIRQHFPDTPTPVPTDQTVIYQRQDDDTQLYFLDWQRDDDTIQITAVRCE